MKKLTAQLAVGNKGKAAREVNRDLRAEKFQTLFSNPLFGTPEGLFRKREPKATRSVWSYAKCLFHEMEVIMQTPWLSHDICNREMEETDSQREGQAHTRKLHCLCNSACTAPRKLSRPHLQSWLRVNVLYSLHQEVRGEENNQTGTTLCEQFSWGTYMQGIYSVHCMCINCQLAMQSWVMRPPWASQVAKKWHSARQEWVTAKVSN